ncbi:O-antigen ligase family protein [Aquipseudomonas alcaligenes]|uniref:O-antigen ligase family protein n=1 Tax=Aquipseudomonas alcaligenes TaxID=43263 RepID=UPI001F19B0E9|nr:O-antigen ligase family protein [Pseudomonas alcaligenes]
MDRIKVKDRSQWREVLFALLALGFFVQLAGLIFNHDGSRYATQCYLLLFVPALLYFLTGGMRHVLWQQLPILLLALLLSWVLLVGGFHPGSNKSFLVWGKLVLLIALYLFAVASLVRSKRHLSWVLGGALAVAILFAWWTLVYQYGVLGKPYTYPEARQFRLSELGWHGLADLDHPIVAGLYYGVFAVVLCWFFVSFPVRIWQGALLAVGMIGLLLYVLFTFSRGAWFSLAGATFLLLLLVPNRKSFSLMGLGGIALVLLALFFWPEIQAERSVGLNNREPIWTSWISRLPEFWLFGSGGGADFYFRFPGGYEVFHAHSLYLQFWYEFGIIGILLFVGLLLSLLHKAWQCREQPLARLGAALLAFAMIAMVSDIYAVFHRPSPYWVVFWLPVGILLGVQKRQQADFG